MVNPLLSTPKKYRVENSFCSYALRVALAGIQKDPDNYNVPETWINILDLDSAKPFEDLPSHSISKEAKEVEEVFNHMLKNAEYVTTYRELALSVAMLLHKLTKENRVDDAGCQGVLVSMLILEEQSNYGDWGSVKRARACAGKLYDSLLNIGYFNCKNLTIH